MNTLYLIGGSPRSGKTTIFRKIVTQKPMLAITTDGLREAIRYTIIEESFATIKKLSFSGQATFHKAGENKDESHTKDFSYDIDQEELTWKNIVGLVNYYDRPRGASIVIEGMAITPERVKSLSLKNLELKVVFLGFTDESHFEKIFEYSNINKDWIHKKINEEDGGDDSHVRKWLKETLEENKKMEALATEYGYSFFSPHEGDFDEYCDKVVKYLLN